MVETAFAALAAALAFSLFLAQPYWFWAALLFSGMPAVRLTHVRGAAAGFAAAGLTALLLAGIGAAGGGPEAALQTALASTICFGLPVLATARVRRGTDPSAAFLLAVVLGAAAISGAVLLSSAPLTKMIGELFDAMASQPPQKGVDSDTVARVAFFLARAREFTIRYYAGLSAFGWVFLAAVWTYTGAFAGRPAPSAERVRFEELRVPAPVVALFVASGAGFTLLRGAAQTAAGDVLLPLLALYFVAGLSIICHFARRWFRSRILRAGLYFLATYVPFCAVVGLLGIFDWYVDFRRRGVKA